MLESSNVLDPRDLVAKTGEEYWCTCGFPPFTSEVCIHRKRAPYAQVGTWRTFKHLGCVLQMRCVDVTDQTLTFREQKES